jgi:Uma2 family endonuclease
MNLTLSLKETEFPVRLRFEQPMTDDELLEFCAENDPFQVERESNGELILMTPSGPKGSSIETRVAIALGVWAEQDGRGNISGATGGFSLPDGSMRIPDAAWTSWAKWNSVPEAQRDSFLPISPEFVIEVRSKTDRIKPLQAKMQMWIDNGVELAWLIDPVRKVVEVYRPGAEVEVQEDPSLVQGTGPVAGFELVMQRIWNW